LGPKTFGFWGDALRLEQVLINLLTNSRDAIVAARREDGGTIRIQVEAESDSVLKIAVSDR
jgi:signal transduction histidine kinase